MRRTIIVVVLAGFVLGGATSTATRATSLPPPDPVELIQYLQDSLKPPKRVLTQGFYRRIATSNQYLILCEANGYGGYAVFTKITKCTMSGSNGGFAKGVTPVTYPSLLALSVGVGGFDTGTFTACIDAQVRYADGTLLSVSECAPAKKLEQGYI